MVLVGINGLTFGAGRKFRPSIKIKQNFTNKICVYNTLK